MLKRFLNLSQPYTVGLYARRSSRKQNERSPDQQIGELKRIIKWLWKIKVAFRDGGVKAALIRKRPKFWQMLNDLWQKWQVIGEDQC